MSSSCPQICAEQEPRSPCFSSSICLKRMRGQPLARSSLRLPGFVPSFASTGSTVIRKLEKIMEIFREAAPDLF